jgi:probable phosphomutase (TIGR03848 family)
MVTLVLIRHAAHDLLGRTLVGRAPAVRLSAAGAHEAEAVAERLAGGAVRALYSSPRERARDTAAPIAARLGVAVEIAPELDEIDFGDWTNRAFAELEELEPWRRFNQFRSGTRCPNGESMLDVQARFLRLVERLCATHAEESVALVSHGDVIRAVLAYYLGIHLDLFQRLEISPASLSIVRLGPYGPEMLLVNGSAESRLLQP